MGAFLRWLFELGQHAKLSFVIFAIAGNVNNWLLKCLASPGKSARMDTNIASQDHNIDIKLWRCPWLDLKVQIGIQREFQLPTLSARCL